MSTGGLGSGNCWTVERLNVEVHNNKFDVYFRHKQSDTVGNICSHTLIKTRMQDCNQTCVLYRSKNNISIVFHNTNYDIKCFQKWLIIWRASLIIKLIDVNSYSVIDIYVHYDLPLKNLFTIFYEWNERFTTHSCIQRRRRYRRSLHTEEDILHRGRAIVTPKLGQF